jgi:hypothetical protein
MNRNESHVMVIEDHRSSVIQGGNMSITAIGSPVVPSAADQKRFQYPDQFGRNSGLPGQQSSVSAKMVSEYYSSQSISVEYTSKDGDTVSFSMESVKYAKASMDLSATGNKDDMKALVDYIKDNFDKMRKEMIRGFLKSAGIDVPENEDAAKVDGTETLQIPEEWNAENTSQRIVDFAVSFFDAFKGAGDEFLSTIKDAVEEGFKQARDMLGELPGQVSNLIDDTYKLVMEKLDAWGVEQGITAQEQEQTA